MDFTPPAIQTATLDNGLKLYLVEKHELPLVEVRLNVMRGWAADPAGKPGTAALTADLLDEGAGSMDALEISETTEALGARLRTGSFFDGSFVSLNVLKSQLEPGLDLMSQVALEPTFPEAEFERVRQNYLGRQQQESRQPRQQAIKEFQKRFFGEDHPYAQPFSGSGTKESLAALTRDDLVAFPRGQFPSRQRGRGRGRRSGPGRGRRCGDRRPLAAGRRAPRRWRKSRRWPLTRGRRSW